MKVLKIEKLEKHINVGGNSIIYWFNKFWFVERYSPNHWFMYKTNKAWICDFNYDNKEYLVKTKDDDLEFYRYNKFGPSGRCGDDCLLEWDYDYKMDDNIISEERYWNV